MSNAFETTASKRMSWISRRNWEYVGTKAYSKPGSETVWTEKVELHLKLVPR